MAASRAVRAYRMWIVIPLLLLAPSAGAEWWLWESPADDETFVDVSQTAFNNYNFTMDGHGVGQSFVPTHPFLYRMDFMLASAHDRRPFTIRLWKWVDQAGTTPGCAEDVEYAPTVSKPPVWQETLSLPGPSERVLRTFFPRIAVQPGALYYVEFHRDQHDGEWEVYSNWDPADLYPSGAMRVNGHFFYEESCAQGAPPPEMHGDLYFRTYYAAGAAPEGPTCAAGSPAPCFSPAAEWIEPLPSGPPITAQDYRSVIENAATRRDEFLGGPSDVAADWTMLDAFLYETGGSAENAEYALALFRRAYEWRVLHPEQWVAFVWTEYPGWAYYWLRDYDGLTSEDRAMIGSLLLRSGQTFWPDRELGAFDHALGGALTYTLLTALFSPADLQALSTCSVPLPPGYPCLFGPGEALGAADHAAWKAYADQVWAYFTANWDFTDDCANYQFGLDFRYVLELDRLRVENLGEPSIWEAPEFRNLVERFAKLLTPLGPSPVYGDTYGWNQNWGNPALLFETAAARLHDARYRWLAYRVFDYQRSHIRSTTWSGDPIAPWEAVYNEYPAFAQAYFAVDESLPTAVPPPQSEQVAAKHDQAVLLSWTAGPSAIGQTFKPTVSPLVRLEFQMDNLGSAVPLTFRLWTWNGNYAATVAAQPLYEDSVDAGGLPGYQLRSVIPFLDVAVGQTYFFEFSRGQPFRTPGGGSTQVDEYLGGDVYLAGSALKKRDLWFKTYTLSADGSAVTWRRDVDTLLLGEVGDPPQAQLFGEKDVPDKLILRSGNASQDLHAVFNLIADFYSNAHAETGSLVSLVYEGAPLITGSSYYDQQDKDEASAVVRRYWGGTRAEAADASEVEVRDSRLTTVATIRWDDPRGWDLDQERRIFFVKNRLLWVRDHVSFGSSVVASAGNVWHASAVRPEHGPDWYDVYNDVPRGLNGFQYKAPERYLLIRFLDRGYAMDEWQVGCDCNPPTAAFVFGQRWNGSAAAGASRWFDTVLLPHGPEVAPWAAAAGITTLYDDGVNAAVRVVTDGESWTLVDNPGKAAIDTGSLVTDATYLVARTTAGAPYLLTREASQVHVEDASGGVVDWNWPVPTSVEYAGGAAKCPATQGCGGPACVPGAVLGETDSGLNLCAPATGGLIQCGAGKTVRVVETACRATPCPLDLRSRPSKSTAKVLEPRACRTDCGTSKTLVCK